MSTTLQSELKAIASFMAAVWGISIIGWLSQLSQYGVIPRTWQGLLGIPLMPFLHADWGHLTANSVPLAMLLFLLAGSKANSWEVVIALILLGGGLLWLFGRTANHIGASGLVFGLIGFLIVSGLLERRLIPLIVSLAVCFFYGGTLFSGIIPRIGAHVSWEGHLLGAIAGAGIAYWMTAGATTIKME